MGSFGYLWTSFHLLMSGWCTSSHNQNHHQHLSLPHLFYTLLKDRTRHLTRQKMWSISLAVAEVKPRSRRCPRKWKLLIISWLFWLGVVIMIMTFNISPNRKSSTFLRVFRWGTQRLSGDDVHSFFSHTIREFNNI